jgi:hypothetical protein
MSKSISFRRKDVAGPPAGEPWIWHTVTLLRSMAWRGKSQALSRLLEFLEIEHLAHGGMENGRLLAPYKALVEFGIRHKSIAAAVRDGERRKLLVANRQGRDLLTGKKLAATYRLTYLPARGLDCGTYEWNAPTDDWRLFFKEQRPAAKIQKPRGENAPTTGAKTPHGGAQDLRESAINQGAKTPLLSISCSEVGKPTGARTRRRRLAGPLAERRSG